MTDHNEKGQALWNRAKKTIPGGSQLLSKRAELFLPDFWPSYFSKAKGVEVWDLDGKCYLDMSLMGVGTSTLGYGCDEVDLAVQNVVSKGNMTSLNCPEEVYLAEKLVELHPWADMVRFARSGGEANAIAIRVARAASGKHNVAFCGYHGWHDWYIAANLGGEENLENHLLPGLAPAGVHEALQGTAFPFDYNDLPALKKLVQEHNIGVIKMEVMRNIPPKDGFLQGVRDLASENGIVLIFDECTSGFRESFGGIHLNFNVVPDVMVLGKALGNGYAITAVLGQRNVMETAQSSFISSTFWTERIGPTAALASLAKMDSLGSWEILPRFGRLIKQGWESLANQYDLPILVQGIDAIPSFVIQSEAWLPYKTLITQQCLKSGILAGNLFYPSTAHKEEDFHHYFDVLDGIFSLIAECEAGRDVMALLDGEVCHSGFKRLN